MGKGTIYEEDAYNSFDLWEENRYVNVYADDPNTANKGKTTWKGLDGYNVPCSASGSGYSSTISVYGIHAEVDPRTALVDDTSLVI